MWPLAIIAGIACNVVGLLLAERSSRAGQAAFLAGFTARELYRAGRRPRQREP
jgi:hypothetical protein